MSQLTKRALEQSLKNLLAYKPLTKITVGDIADDCGINRMTFYYHFKDIYMTLSNGHVLRMRERRLIRTRLMIHGSRAFCRYLKKSLKTNNLS